MRGLDAGQRGGGLPPPPRIRSVLYGIARSYVRYSVLKLNQDHRKAGCLPLVVKLEVTIRTFVARLMERFPDLVGIS